MEAIIKSVDSDVLGDLLERTTINYLSLSIFKQCKHPKNVSFKNKKVIIVEEEGEGEDEPNGEPKKKKLKHITEKDIIYSKFKITNGIKRMFNKDVYPYWKP